MQVQFSTSASDKRTALHTISTWTLTVLHWEQGTLGPILEALKATKNIWRTPALLAGGRRWANLRAWPVLGPILVWAAVWGSAAYLPVSSFPARSASKIFMQPWPLSLLTIILILSQLITYHISDVAVPQSMDTERWEAWGLYPGEDTETLHWSRRHQLPGTNNKAQSYEIYWTFCQLKWALNDKLVNKSPADVGGLGAALRLVLTHRTMRDKFKGVRRELEEAGFSSILVEDEGFTLVKRDEWVSQFKLWTVNFSALFLYFNNDIDIYLLGNSFFISSFYQWVHYYCL